MAGADAELARELEVRGHAVGVQSMVGLGLLAHGVQPGERGAARAVAWHSGVERDDARASSRRRIRRRRAYDPESDNSQINLFHRHRLYRFTVERDGL